MFYSFYLSASFAFAENIIDTNENIEDDVDFDEDSNEISLENKTEEEINDDKLFKELNSDIDNFDLEESVRNKFENYQTLEYKELSFETKITNLSDFDVIDFIMNSNLYMCLKEDKKIQKKIKETYSYVIIDILGYDKDSANSYYSDYFKVNNNNFMVEVIINKNYDDYSIQINIIINGEQLF